MPVSGIAGEAATTDCDAPPQPQGIFIMTIRDEFQRQLQQTAGPGPVTVKAMAGEVRAICELEELDRFAAACRTLRVESSALAQATLAQLQDLSTQLANRLTYLLEPVSPVESDGESCTVQMRSNPPQRDDDGTRYYELMVRRGGSIALQRWHTPRNQSRQAIPAELTREVLVRLVGDFNEAIAKFDTRR